MYFSSGPKKSDDDHDAARAAIRRINDSPEPSLDFSSKLVFSKDSIPEAKAQARAFYQIAGLRARLQQSHPEWAPTEAQRWLVGEIRDCSAMLHPDTLSEEGAPSATEIEIATERAMRIFTNAYLNIARYEFKEPLLIPSDKSGNYEQLDPSAEEYESNAIASRWVVLTAFYTADKNERMFDRYLSIMQQHHLHTYAILISEESFNVIFGALNGLRTASSAAQQALLRHDWLGLNDLPASS